MDGIEKLPLTRATDEDEWKCSAFKPSTPQIALFITGAALAVLAALATYFALSHGFNMYDTAYTSGMKFGAGFLIYAGVTFSVVAVGNFIYTGYKLTFSDEKGNDYTPNEAKIQIAISIFAPVVAGPGVIVAALFCVANRH